MNTKNLKAYAPKARTQFIEAVKKRAAQFGIYEGEDGKVRIEEVRVEGGAAIIEGRAFTRKEGEQRKRLESKVVERGYDMFIREMAYTWFNRLAALRYMEIHDYFDHGFRVLSHPTNSDSLPEILSHASDVADSLGLDKSQIIELQLAGDKEEELYRELLLGQCHHLYKIMPFMFEAIDDATELLLPSNLTKTDSILKGLINDIPEEDWQEIEVIGWLYQFYISEHKDAVIGKVVKSEDIPAATQLFTPNWIVKYLVQNSVGRQWLATYPDSELKGKMEYYIEPAEQSEEVIEQLKAITPTSIDPEEIKVLDPACGSGHILVEVYEVLREIYLERGYRLREIPELILTKNIYGLDIDDRAAQLAAFALMMKAREDDRRIFQRVEDGDVSLNVFSMQSTENLDIPKLWKALDLEGNQQTGSTGGLFDTAEEFVQPTGIYKDYFELLQVLKSVFKEAKTLGSLIQIEHQYLDNVIALKEKLNKKLNGSDPAAKKAAQELAIILNQTILLAQKYDAVIANPPYMGNKYQNSILKKHVKSCFKGSEKDSFSAFTEQCLHFSKAFGGVGIVAPYVWMFLSSYQKFREKLFEHFSLLNLVQLEYNAFEPAMIPVATFTGVKGEIHDFESTYIRLSDFKGHKQQAPKTLEAIKNPDCGWLFKAKVNDFRQIPSMPIAYWVSPNIRNAFAKDNSIKECAKTLVGLQTDDNDRFIRQWYEVSKSNFYATANNSTSFESKGVRWAPISKGGGFRKWYGLNSNVVNWKNNGLDIKEFTKDSSGGRINNEEHYFEEGVTWGLISNALPSFRYEPNGFIFNVSGPKIFSNFNVKQFASYLNSKVSHYLLSILTPSLSFTPGTLGQIPFPELGVQEVQKIEHIAHRAIELSKHDWDSYECSWDFKESPLVSIFKREHRATIMKCCDLWYELANNHTKELKALEEKNNSFYINLFGVEDDVSSDVPIEQITLNYNPKFRYGNGLQDSDLKLRFISDSVVDALSYSVGCMMGRYSLDRQGLVYANFENRGFKDIETDYAYQTFPADDDGIIPLASEEWLFDDDATTRFKEFVKTVWADEHLSENLDFVAESLCLHALKPKKGEGAMDTIRRYFSTQFFKDHCKTYKKRPIYWLFSSGKEKAFECLVYLHRYNEGTLSRIRTEYVTPLMGKYDAQHTLLSEQKLEASGAEARRIEKDLKSLEKKQAELRTFDEQLKHYAEKRITLDLDDGVKANYGKFGNLLADVKAIHGKAVK